MHGSSEVVGPTFMMRLQPFDRRRMTGFAVGLSLCGGEKASVLLSLSPLSEIGRFVVAPHRRLPHRTPDRHLRAFPRKRSPSAPILRACVPLPRTLVPRLRPVGGLPAPEFSLRGTAAGPFAPVRTSRSGCARLRQIKEKQNFTKGKRSDREPFVTGRGRRKKREKHTHNCVNLEKSPELEKGPGGGVARSRGAASGRGEKGFGKRKRGGKLFRKVVTAG